MSEVVEGQSESNVEQPQVSAEDFAAMKEQIERLTSTNQRLLEESKTYKSKAQQKAEELEQIERQKLQDAGKLEELLELERNKAHQAETRAKSLERETMKRSLQLEVASHARDARDLKLVLAAINADDFSYDEATGAFKGVDQAVSNVKSTHPFLFESKSMPSTPDGRPAANVPRDLTLQDKIADKGERNNLLNEALNELLK